MMVVSIPAVYDGERVSLLEEAPIEGSYRVVVTFVEPADAGGGSRAASAQADAAQADAARFEASFGAWQDDRLLAETLREIHEARQSREEASLR
jgi:hypothetical protein